jgi:hypothetical protein
MDRIEVSSDFISCFHGRRNPPSRRASRNRNRSVEFPWEMFTLKELVQATNNFNDSNKLGEGGFGTVYWGRTSKGVEVID